MLTDEQKHDIGNYVRQILSSGIVDKKVGDTPLEAYDLVNKKYVDNRPCGVAPGTNTTIGASYTPTLIPITTPTILNGVTYQTGAGFKIQAAGNYLVLGVAYYNNPNQIGIYESMIYVNGLSVAKGYTLCYSSGLEVAPLTAQILALNAGDIVELYGQQQGSNTQTVLGANSYLSIVKV